VKLFRDIAALEEQGRRFVLATVIAASGSTPQKPGAKLLVLETGELRGTIGGGAIEKQIIDAALTLLADPTAEVRTLDTHLTHDLGMCCGGRMTVFLEKSQAVPLVVLFGAGHVAQAVALAAHHAGFRVSVVDERAEWLTAERFPHAERRLESPEDVARTLSASATTFCCVVTHDHPLDQRCVAQLLPRGWAYLGVIGSERKAARFRQRLEADGFTPEQLARLECPMGVDIAALTPSEIAVSIVARLIAVRRHAAL
jgi:xanthine dehydrogenase accessory factor